jgi:hypothetical protein
MEKIEFDCNGNNAPAYSCNKPYDNSGSYYQSTDVDEVLEAKDKRIAELEDGLRNVCKHMVLSVPTGYELSGAWNIASRALSNNKERGDD